MAQEFETGLSTAAANDTALTVSNYYAVYVVFRLHRGVAGIDPSIVVRKACRRYGREMYGRSFIESKDFNACVEYVIRRWTES